MIDHYLLLIIIVYGVSNDQTEVKNKSMVDLNAFNLAQNNYDTDFSNGRNSDGWDFLKYFNLNLFGNNEQQSYSK